MKAQVLQEDFNKGLATVSRIAAGRSQLPILSNVLLEATRDGLSLGATNLEIGMRLHVGGKVTEEGSITIPARNLTEFVSSLSSGPIDLETLAEKLKITTAKSSANFSGISASEFPGMPTPQDKDVSLSISRGDLADISKQVAFSAATDESRPVLTGIQFKVVDENLFATSTDGFRMSQKRISNIKFKISNSLILPAKTIVELAKLAEHTKNDAIEMVLLTENNQVLFRLDQVELVSRILEGNFPDVNKIIPQEFLTTLIVDKQDWLKAVRSAAIFARENNNIIKFRIQDSIIKVTAIASQLGENVTEVEADISGDGGEIAFNYKFVTDFLTNIESERIIFKFSSSTTPGVFIPEKDPSLIHLIMPVRLQS
jgi:DNA polymerase III subunit beta